MKITQNNKKVEIQLQFTQFTIKNKIRIGLALDSFQNTYYYY